LTARVSKTDTIDYVATDLTSTSTRPVIIEPDAANQPKMILISASESVRGSCERA
jgi:hypothetical protein